LNISPYVLHLNVARVTACVHVIDRNSSGPAKAYLCRQAARRWPYAERLQHSKGVHPAPRAPLKRRW